MQGKETDGCNHNYYMTKSDVKKLLEIAEDHMNDKWEIAMKFLAFLGLRRSEVVAIHKNDFLDWREDNLSWLRVRRAKSGRIEHKYVVEDFQEEIKQFYDDHKAQIEKNGGYLFTSRNPRGETQHVTADALSQAFIRLRKKAVQIYPELDQKCPDCSRTRIRMHGFRNWVITKLCVETKDPMMVKRVAGHKDLETTMDYFYDVNYKEKLPNVMENCFGELASEV